MLVLCLGCGSGGVLITPNPAFAPGTGTYTGPQSVVLTDELDGSRIFYTTDRTLPTVNSAEYRHPIAVAATQTITAIAVAKGFSNSQTVAATYTIAEAPTATPIFDPPAGSYASPQSVVISDTNPTASIFFTTDGSTPTSSSTPYTSPIPVSSTTTVEAIAIAPSHSESSVATAVYTITEAQTAVPTFNPPAGTYSTAQSVAISDSTPSASIFFTTDGSQPTPASAAYTTPISVSATSTLEAIAIAPNHTKSPLAVATYTIGSTPSGKGQWTWMGGSTLADADPVYGTMGTPSSANTPGGVISPITFTRPDGTFWLFGGSTNGSLGVRNTLWKYDPAASTWTWIDGSDTSDPAGTYGTQGVPSASNAPPPRYSAPNWTDGTGNFYMFGGLSDPQGYSTELSDFWKFNPASPAWTWIAGSQTPLSFGSYGTIGTPSPTNFPEARADSASCNDNEGNFWMFGGAGPYPPFGNVGYLNDLWRYNPTTGLWTWISGSDQANQAGTYGSLGVPGAANTPGGRFFMPCWTDLSGNLWFFGGYGIDADPSLQGFLENNDLWTFNPTTHLWTWIGGSSTHNTVGVYGTLGVPDPDNIPGSRDQVSHWTGKDGDLWLFGGGVTNPFYGSPIIDNDLWRYNIASGQWTWMSGSISGANGGPSVYGTLGIPSPNNYPSARDSAATWVDKDGNLWLFGGLGYDSAGNGGNLSDLWRYQP